MMRMLGIDGGSDGVASDTIPIVGGRPVGVDRRPVGMHSPAEGADRYQALHLTFDDGKLRRLFVERFAGFAKFAAANGENLVSLAKAMAVDPQITDLRWMAYMLATAYWETAVTVSREVPKRVKGKALLNKAGQPIMKTIKVWQNLAPSEEAGHGVGRAYGPAVKVSQAANGGMRVLEQDGDAFIVAADGKAKVIDADSGKPRLIEDGERGSAAMAKATKAYATDTGVEKAYFGRGYVHLTWWDSYASAGAMIGRNLELLANPDLAMDSAIAYQVMVKGMTTGASYANGRKLGSYIGGLKTDYEGARRIINGTDCRDEIAAVARAFEAVLLDSRVIE